VVITNYPEGKVEYLDADNNAENPDLGTRKIAFSRNLYIEREDFMPEKPNKQWKRLSKDVEVRLFNAYFIKCTDVFYDDLGKVAYIHATYDPETRSGSGFDGRKPNGTIHFVEESTAIPATFNLFEPLILDEEVSTENFIERLNPNSWIVQKGFVEASLKDVKSEEKFQFLRNGYFVCDTDSKPNNLVFNRTVSLKSSFTK
jgi:glutaminyl-tRNA synthetase